MNMQRRSGQCGLLAWAAFIILFKCSAAWSATDAVTLAWPEKRTDQNKLERKARLVLMSKIGSQMLQFDWDENIQLSDSVKTSIETGLRRSVKIRFEIEDLTLIKKEWQDKNVTFTYNFNKPPVERISIGVPDLAKAFALALRLPEGNNKPAFVELALTYPSIASRETTKKLWRSFLPYFSYEVVFDKKILSFDSVKFSGRQIPVDELPTTLESSLRLLDLAPTNSGVCSHNVKLAEPEYPHLAVLLRNHCDLLPNESSLKARNNVRLKKEIEKLKDSYDVRLEDNPLLNFWIKAHKNFTFDPLLIQLNPVFPGKSQEMGTLLDLFKGLPLDHLHASLIEDFILALRQNGFAIIPAELAALPSNTLRKEDRRENARERLNEFSNQTKPHSELRPQSSPKKESQDNSKMGIY